MLGVPLRVGLSIASPVLANPALRAFHCDPSRERLLTERRWSAVWHFNASVWREATAATGIQRGIKESLCRSCSAKAARSCFVRSANIWSTRSMDFVSLVAIKRAGTIFQRKSPRRAGQS